MLRSIFSLIQNIIDSDKEYNNKKSNTVIYLVSTPDNTFNMDLEIDGKPRENLKSLKVKDGEKSSSSFKIATEQGDTVNYKKLPLKKNCTKQEEKLSTEYKANVGKVGERATFSNEEEIIGDREVDEDKKFEGTKETKVHELLADFPQEPVKSVQKDKDQITALMEQIQKMKLGMERLQEIAQQFNTSDQFKKDVEFLAKNVTAALKSPKVEDKNIEKPS